MTDTIEEEIQQSPRMSPEELWAKAQKFHEAMADEIEQAGDMIGTCAIMFTNMLIGGVMSGADMKFVNMMLDLVRADVENGVEHLTNTMSTVQ